MTSVGVGRRVWELGDGVLAERIGMEVGRRGGGWEKMGGRWDTVDWEKNSLDEQ